VKILEIIKKWYRKKTKSWDDICNRCGLCCYEKEENSSGVLVINLKKPCSFYNVSTRECLVFDNRFKKNRRCRKVGIFQALFSAYLPDSCAYVLKYRAKMELIKDWRNK